MSKTDNLYIEEAQQGIMNGVSKAAQVVGETIGTSGANVLIECFERPGHFSTNDGATILGAMKFADPLEEMGRQILFEAVNRANRASGDGSSTTAVLTAAILEQGMSDDVSNQETSPMELKKSLEACIPEIEELLKEQRRFVDVHSVGQVASISAEDEGIGQRIQEIYEQIGKEGIITWDVSKTPEDSYSIGRGITMSGATVVTQYMFDPGTQETRLENCPVLLCKDKITSALEFESLFKQLFQQGEKQILIFANEIDVPVVVDLLQTQRIRGFRTIVVKMPVLWNDEWWEDLEKASGGQVISKAAGSPLVDVKASVLGSFERVTIKREETIIEGTQDLSKHLLSLKVDGSDKALNRAARLNTKTARYFVGAHSETALAYRRLKVEDAINAASCALENGVVVGGGIALYNASEGLKTNEKGASILRDALKSPFEAIVRNAGGQAGKVGGEVGFNSKTGKTENLVKQGILDPYDVVLNAVKNAIGVAAAVLTTRSVILLDKPDNDEVPRKV